MQAQASTAAEDQRGNDQARLRAARSLNPDAEPGLVMVLDDTGTANPQRVLVGLKTRTTAEIIYGLSRGQTVVTGNVSVARPRARDENNENRDRSTQMGRRGSGRR
jgi:macrolide-specific efflux system membrane fusion protein